MKLKIILFLGLLFINYSSFSQQTDGIEKYDYAFDGLINLKKFNITPNLNDTLWRAEKFRYNKIAEDNFKSGNTEFDYVVLKLINFNNKYEYIRKDLTDREVNELINDIDLKLQSDINIINKELPLKISEVTKPSTDLNNELILYNKNVDSISKLFQDKVKALEKDVIIKKDSIYKNSKNLITNIIIKNGTSIFCKKIDNDTIKYIKNYVNIDDQDKMFWLKKDKFEKLLNQGYIKKRYEWPVQVAYGANLSIPFKIRPQTDSINMKITPEISLGGFIGLRKRLNRYKPIYLYAPVITAGVTTIGINKDNVIDETNTDTKDGLVLARTFSVGSFIEFNSFQLGFLLGWDKAGGEIAKDWIYNDRLWYSFSIGYNFLRRNDE
jgi:hypothetical protein